jgi:radical SAM protein with 4Fe4S-binding SPASM domain
MNYLTTPLKSPLMIELTMTQLCNHKCLHCYNPWRQKENPNRSISSSEIDTLLMELQKNEVFHLVISGGEPLADYKTLKPLLENVSKTNLSVSLNSNLTLINKDIAVELKNYGIDVILTSLPSAREDECNKILGHSNAFQKIVKGIQVAQEAGLEVLVNAVINKRNINSIYETAEFVAGLGVNYLSFTVATPPSYAKSDMNYLLTNEEIKKIGDTLIAVKQKYNLFIDTITPLPLCALGDMAKYGNISRRACSAGVTHFTVGYDGETFACSHENSSYGNIKSDGIKDIWQAMENWRLGKNLHNQCSTCDYLDVCGGECRMMSKSFPDRKYTNKPILENLSSIQRIYYEFPVEKR